MTPSEYLDAAKAAMGLQTDYELAQRLDIPRGHVAEMRHGQRAMKAYVAAKIAVTLNLDPAQVIADLEAQREKNPKKRAFWQSFLSRAAMLGLACTLGWISSDLPASELKRLGGQEVRMLDRSISYVSVLIYGMSVYADNLYYVKSRPEDDWGPGSAAQSTKFVRILQLNLCGLGESSKSGHPCEVMPGVSG